MEKNQKEKLSKPKIAILVTFALVLLFIFTFGCYGCSYQPVFEEPTVEEAIDVVSRLGQSMGIDDTEGIPLLLSCSASVEGTLFGSAVVQASELEEHSLQPIKQFCMGDWF